MDKKEQTLKFTDGRIAAIPVPQSGRLEIGDAIVPGLRIRVNQSGAKSFIVRRRLAGAGNPIRVTLGRYPDLNVKTAHSMARQVINDLAAGIDPRERKRAQRTNGMTLRQVCEEYLELHKRRHKESYQNDIKRTLRVELAPMADKSVVKISAKDVIKWHGAFQSRSNADKCAKLLKALLRFASDKHDLRGDGVRISTDCLRTLRLMQTPRRRQTVIGDMQQWRETIDALPQPAVRDLLVTLSLTGLRRDEWRTATWRQVDVERGTIYLPDPKNRQPITLPLARQVVEILQRRRDEARGLERAASPDEPIFSITGRVPVSKVTLARVVKATQEAAGKWALHDLRRGFISLADTLVPRAVAKRLVGHAVTDVHDGYVVLSLEQLRIHLQKVVDALCRSTTAEVVDLATVRGHNEQKISI
jgi:integrase